MARAIILVLFWFLLAVHASNMLVPQWKQRLQDIHHTIQQYNFVRRSSNNHNLLPLLQERKQLLKELIQHAPNDAIDFCFSTQQQRQAYLNLLAASDANSSNLLLLEQQVHVENASLAIVITMNHAQEEQQHETAASSSSTVERFVHLHNKTYHAHVHSNYSASSGTQQMDGYLLDDMFLIRSMKKQQRTTRASQAMMTSQGSKRLLYIRVDFADLPGEPVQQATVNETLTNLREFWRNASYGSLTLESWTITPTLRLPQTAAHYAKGTNYIQLQQDARTIATQRGYAYGNYNFDVIFFAKISPGWAGRGYVQMQGVWMNGNTQLYAHAHELGHNMGLWHSNSLNSDETPKVSYGGRATHEEYGDYSCVMGRCTLANCHYNLRNKMKLNWVPASSIKEITTSGTFVVYAYDNVTSAASDIMGLKLRVNRLDSTQYYLLSYRSLAISNSMYDNNGGKAMDLHMAYSMYNDKNATHVLDATPATRARDPIFVNQTWTSNTNTPTYHVLLKSVSCSTDSPCTATVKITIE